MENSQIKAMASYFPATILTNEELAGIYPGWSSEKIFTKTGIRERRIAADDETASDMAIRAAENLFEKEQISRDNIDFIIFCTQASDYILPTSACLIQHALGIPKRAGAVDINLGCSGFVYALALANGLIASKSAKNVLVLTADTYSKFIHPMDKSVRTLFGDAATATLVVAAKHGGKSIGPFEFGTDGSGAKDLIVETGGSRVARSAETAVEVEDSSGNIRSRDNLYMDGSAVMGFTLREVPRVVSALLERTGLTRDDIDLFILHQANRFMLDALRKKLAVPEEKLPIRMELVGNTVSSTIPLVLAELFDNGELQNKRIMLVGFGVGLSWAASLINT